MDEITNAFCEEWKSAATRRIRRKKIMPIVLCLAVILIISAVYILSDTDKNSGSEIAPATTTAVTTTVSTKETIKVTTADTTTASKVTSKTTAKTTATTTTSATTSTTTAATVTTVTADISSDEISLKSGYENGIVVSVGQTINVLAFLDMQSDVRGFDFSVQSDGEYIKMLASGELTAVAPGTAYVTISPKNIESECTLKVTVRG